MNAAYDLISRLRDLDGKLNAREQRVATYVLENFGSVVEATLGEVAAAAEVSEPTVIRFCRTLGCEGFKDFKLRLAQNVAVSLQSLENSNVEARGASPTLDRVLGGIYAAGVLGWSIIQIGLFGILGTITGATFAWLGGKADGRFGPKPVIAVNVTVLTLVALGVIFVSRSSVFGISVGPQSALPDIAFYGLGIVIGAAGGALQSASRTMMVRQADPRRMTEAFGLYALTGKATSFIAPLSIGVVTDLTGSQQLGIAPLLVLFLIGLVLLVWVKADGERQV